MRGDAPGALLVLALLLSSGCQGRFSSSASAALTCEALGTRDRAGEGLVIEGDLAFARAQDATRFLSERLPAGTEGHAPDTHLVVSSAGFPHAIYPTSVRADVTWCVSSEFGEATQRITEAVATAMATWSEVTGVVFRRVEPARCAVRGEDARIVVIPRCLAPAVIAQAMLPYREGLRGQELELNTCQVGRDALFASPEALGTTALHETGHLLGFVHAWNTEDYVGACACSASTAFLPVSGWDVDSIMGYPSCGASWELLDAPSLSMRDRADAVRVYCPASSNPLRCEPSP